jgi:hexosaminidase
VRAAQREHGGVRFVLAFVAAIVATTSVASALPALVPQPRSLSARACPAALALDRPLALAAGLDPGGVELVRERWAALDIPAPLTARGRAAVRASERPSPPGGYELTVDGASVTLRASSPEGRFNALATLAQLPERQRGRWVLPCVQIVDAPAMRRRIVSDDISRGPFPTMRYFEERIRTLASFKINGYSPYMENVFDDPRYPIVAFPERLTAAQLHHLAVYARRFHVTLIPEQQTFAHMHEVLKWEQLAPLAELPHGYLLAESDPATYAYLLPLIRAELAAAAPVPFFHLGADEPIDLGRGRTPRTPQVFAAHVRQVAAPVIAAGARPMIWDDAIQSDPSILTLIPKQTVIVTFHYGAEHSFANYIGVVDRAGFDQLIAPGAANWNELYPDLTTAYANIAQFAADAQAAHSPHVLGMFATVWHDDGESLYEATWAPLAFAAASAWQRTPVDRATWHRTFARVFFGSDDPGFGADLEALRDIRDALRTGPDGDPSDYLFWADPFDARIGARVGALDLAGVRRRAEAVFDHLADARPPLHANAAAVMQLAALRYDVLARRFQIGAEVRADYDDARAHAGAHADGIVERDLNIAKYLCWELRDELTALAPRYARAWDYESRPSGRDRVLVRFALAAQQAVTDADKLNQAAREDYVRGGTLPPFDELLGTRP